MGEGKSQRRQQPKLFQAGQIKEYIKSITPIGILLKQLIKACCSLC